MRPRTRSRARGNNTYNFEGPFYYAIAVASMNILLAECLSLSRWGGETPRLDSRSKQ